MQNKEESVILTYLKKNLQERVLKAFLRNQVMISASLHPVLYLNMDFYAEGNLSVFTGLVEQYLGPGKLIWRAKILG